MSLINDQLEVIDRLNREQTFYDELIRKGSKARGFLDLISSGFYDKGPQGRLWAPIWNRIDFRSARVLDYGCGRGSFSHLLTGLGAEVCGLDISPELIKIARAETPTGSNGFPQFFVGDAHHTPFEDAAFDYVVGNGALHHLNLDRAYAEIARVLKPGGWAFFMEPMYKHPMLWLLRRLTPQIHTVDERPLSLPDIERGSRWFRSYSWRAHFLFAVCAAPAHILGDRFALFAIDRLDVIDQFLMTAMPRLRQFAWLAMLEMQK
jgi:SAM-dependent methyltransferase